MLTASFKLNAVGLRLLPFFGLMLLSFSSAYTQTYQTGRRVITYSDPSRSNRQITTDVFYPADAAGNNVPIANGANNFPCVVFGHGFVLPVSAYGWLADSLVKYGYIVAMPGTESGFSPSHDAFGKDLAYVNQAIKAEGNQPGSFLYQRVGPKSAVAGHSMGGGCSFLAAASSSDIQAIFNFAAAETNPSAAAAALLVNKPALIFAGSNDCIVPPSVQSGFYTNIPFSCKALVNITGALHCQFANNNATCAFGQITSGCNNSPITAATVYNKIQSLLLPFLDYYIKDICTRGDDYVLNLNNLTGVVSTTNCINLPGCGTVPVRLLEFTGSFQNGSARLSWTTELEIGLTEFIVEKRMNTEGWKTIDRIPGSGGTGTRSYSVNDLSFKNGSALYRLRMNFADGRHEWSKMVLIRSGNAATEIVSLYPNPSLSNARLTVYAVDYATAKMQIFDIKGSLLHAEIVNLQKGINEINLPSTTSIPEGLKYVLLFAADGKKIGSVRWMGK